MGEKTWHPIWSGLFLLALVGIAFFGAYSGSHVDARSPTVPSEDRLVDLTADLAEFTAYLFLATAIMGIATIALAVLAFDQGRTLKASIAVSDRAARAAEMNARAAIGMELPVLRCLPGSLGSATVSNASMWQVMSGPPLALFNTVTELRFVNNGRTPAFPVLVELGWELAAELSGGPNYCWALNVEPGSVIKADGLFEFHPSKFVIELTQGRLLELRKRQTTLWIFGRMVYQDFMDQTHSIGFCWRWTPYSERSEAYYFFADPAVPKAFIERS